MDKDYYTDELGQVDYDSMCDDLDIIEDEKYQESKDEKE